MARLVVQRAALDAGDLLHQRVHPGGARSGERCSKDNFFKQCAVGEAVVHFGVLARIAEPRASAKREAQAAEVVLRPGGWR